MRPRLPLVLLAGAILTSILWLLVLQDKLRDRTGNTVGSDGVVTALDKLPEPSLLAVVGVQVHLLSCSMQYCGSCELGLSLLRMVALSRLEACLGFDSLLRRESAADRLC